MRLFFSQNSDIFENIGPVKKRPDRLKTGKSSCITTEDQICAIDTKLDEKMLAVDIPKFLASFQFPRCM